MIQNADIQTIQRIEVTEIVQPDRPLLIRGFQHQVPAAPDSETTLLHDS